MIYAPRHCISLTSETVPMCSFQQRQDVIDLSYLVNLLLVRVLAS